MSCLSSKSECDIWRPRTETFLRHSYSACFKCQNRWYNLYRNTLQTITCQINMSLLSCCCCSVAQLCLTLCNPMNCITPGFPLLHYLPELSQTHVHWVGDAIQPSQPLSSPSPPDFSFSQQQEVFSNKFLFTSGAQVLELQLQHQSFQWRFRVDFL